MPQFRSPDERFMALAHDLGRRALGRAWPNPAVGAVIVREIGGTTVIVGRGWTQPGGRPHAETEALRRAGEAARGATVYVTLEPCAHHGRTGPCSEALLKAGVARVVSAMEDVNPQVAGRGHAQLREQGVAVTVGIGAQEARHAHAGHVLSMREGRPYVTLKLALSADGKAGLAGRRPAAITGQTARDRVHLMRAMNDAILIGIGTAISDDPLLTCRLPGMERRSPVRIVADRMLRLPLDCRLVQTAAETPVWVAAGPEAPPESERRLRDRGVDVFRIEARGGGVDPLALVRHLATRGITRLMVEGGPSIAASLVKADLVDEAVLFHAPDRIGPDGIDALEGLPLTALTAKLQRCGIQSCGDDAVELLRRVC